MQPDEKPTPVWRYFTGRMQQLACPISGANLRRREWLAFQSVPQRFNGRFVIAGVSILSVRGNELPPRGLLATSDAGTISPARLLAGPAKKSAPAGQASGRR